MRPAVTPWHSVQGRGSSEEINQWEKEEKTQSKFTAAKILHEFCAPLRHPRELLTMWPSVASPSSPPKVMTGDMQAQKRKRKDARHCRLRPSRKSLQNHGALRFTSRIKPPKSLEEGKTNRLFPCKTTQRGFCCRRTSPSRQ